MKFSNLLYSAGYISRYIKDYSITISLISFTYTPFFIQYKPFFSIIFYQGVSELLSRTASSTVLLNLIFLLQEKFEYTTRFLVMPRLNITNTSDGGCSITIAIINDNLRVYEHIYALLLQHHLCYGKFYIISTLVTSFSALPSPVILYLVEPPSSPDTPVSFHIIISLQL